MGAVVPFAEARGRLRPKAAPIKPAPLWVGGLSCAVVPVKFKVKGAEQTAQVVRVAVLSAAGAIVGTLDVTADQAHGFAEQLFQCATNCRLQELPTT